MIGDVELGDGVSVWPMAVIRGDVNSIRIGARSNVQDGSVLHVTSPYPGHDAGFPLVIGADVVMGHAVVVHGCTVGDGALIGIGSVILDGARVGREAAVGAGAVLAPGAEVPDGMLAVGVPARVMRPLRPEERRIQRERAHHYVEVARHHAEG